jgi:DNA-binding CsgD family transcriptional regulator
MVGVSFGGSSVRAYIIVMEGAAALLLLGLAAWLAIAAWRAPHGPFSVASAGASTACLVFGMTCLQQLFHLATRDDLVSSGWDDMLLGPLAAARVTVVVITTSAVMLGFRQWTILGRAQLMVDAMTDRLPSDASASEAELSGREHEVLDAIRQGVLSDSDIGQMLHISRATAATHVQNILRKTGLHDRRSLMLLPDERSTRHRRRGPVGASTPAS